MSNLIEIAPYDYIQGSIPVLLELPHGGHLTPYEVKSYLHPKFTPGDRREDSDEFSDELYMGHASAPHVLRFNLWRAHADPNRQCDDIHADGAVKTHTSQGVKIYQSDLGLPPKARIEVINNYVRPHRARLNELLASHEIEKIMFCHTMPGIGTRTSDDKGELRPLFMFGNGGDRDGYPASLHFAPRELFLELAQVIEMGLDSLDVDFNFCDVLRFNHPYTGINSLSRFTTNQLIGKIPFTVETNRDLLLHNPDNITPVRDIMNKVIQTVHQWS